VSQLLDLERWMLRALREQLERDHPDVVRRFEESQALGPWGIEKWVNGLDFNPLQPWSDLLYCTVSVRLGLEELAFLSESLRTTDDGRGVWFFQELGALVATSCLERGEHLVKVMRRRRLIAPDLEMTLVGRLKALRETEAFELLRHHAVHGPQIGLQRGGWMESSAKDRLWEVAALKGEDASGFMGRLFAFASANRDGRSEALQPVVSAVNGAVEDVAESLLIGAELTAKERELHKASLGLAGRRAPDHDAPHPP
jgi:hypothetical protein